MDSHDWKEKLRHITSAILSAVGDLHPPRPPAARLAAAAADALHLQERVNIALEDALKRERQWRVAAEQRIRMLEEKLETVINPSSTEEIEQQQDVGPQLTARDKKVGQGDNTPSSDKITSRPRPSCKKPVRDAQQFALRCSLPKKKRQWESCDPIEDYSFGQPSPRPEKEIKGASKNCEEPRQELGNLNTPSNENTGEEPTLERRSKRVRAEKSLPVTPPRKPLPPLPTLKDVEQDWAKRRAERRAREQYKPPPCDKCRLRKRAVMLRKDGYIKEDVFERWAKKPGACLDYMHQDEEVPKDQPRSPLTFDETETQSPP